jgi:TonB family protein
MMRLESSHKPLAGVPGAAMASIPVVLLVFGLLFWKTAGTGGVSEESGNSAKPQRQDSSHHPTSAPAVVADMERVRPPQQKPSVNTGKASSNERVLYSVRWSGKESRRRISGNSPLYPSGVSGEAMVRLELVVSGSGVVKSVKLLSSGNARCDEASLREVRDWQFEPLQGLKKKPDQRCLVTISFFKK